MISESNYEYINLTDADILDLIKNKPNILAESEYVLERYNRLYKFLCKCEDKQYHRISDKDIIKTLRGMPKLIENKYYQKRILRIFKNIVIENKNL